MGAGEVTNVEEIACPLPPSICRDKMVLRLAHRCIGGKKQVILAGRRVPIGKKKDEDGIRNYLKLVFLSHPTFPKKKKEQFSC